MDKSKISMKSTRWHNAKEASRELGIKEETLKQMREQGTLTPGRHWKSICGETKSIKRSSGLPWAPEVVFNVELCRSDNLKLIAYKHKDIA